MTAWSPQSFSSQPNDSYTHDHDKQQNLFNCSFLYNSLSLPSIFVVHTHLKFPKFVQTSCTGFPYPVSSSFLDALSTCTLHGMTLFNAVSTIHITSYATFSMIKDNKVHQCATPWSLNCTDWRRPRWDGPRVGNLLIYLFSSSWDKVRNPAKLLLNVIHCFVV